MNSIFKSRYKYIASGIWIILMMGLCFMPSNGSLSGSWAAKIHLDKIGHFVIFGILAFLLMRDEFSGLKGFLICLVLGMFIEFIQDAYLASRYFEFLDLIANIIGYFAGIGLFQLCKSKAYDK